MPYCTSALAQNATADLQAACAQADAAMQAGMAQASATLTAGYWTFAAGALALIGAIMSVWVARSTTRKQIEANRAEQLRQRQQDLRREIYARAVYALANGLFVLVRMSSPGVPTAEVAAPWSERLSDLFGIHLVAGLDVAERSLTICKNHFISCCTYCSVQFLNLVGIHMPNWCRYVAFQVSEDDGPSG